MAYSAIAYWLSERIYGKQPPYEWFTLDYIKEGYIDSISIIRFVLDIERHFDVRISDNDMSSEKFRSVRGLAGIVESK